MRLKEESTLSKSQIDEELGKSRELEPGAGEGIVGSVGESAAFRLCCYAMYCIPT